jgi:uncharacterized protein YndB with AHSA1/START domain
VPTVRRSRTIDASLEELWGVLGDPHHLPRWWPRVNRVEAVTLSGAGDVDAFTEVLMGPSGKIVRADFKLLEQLDRRRIVWAQQVEGTPFARVLRSAETEIALIEGQGGDGTATEVTIELRQDLQGFARRSGGGSWVGAFSRFGSPLVRRAAHATLDEALDGLERIVGG